MSQLHPTAEDDAFASGHADAGLRKALRRIERLEGLLKRVWACRHVGLSPELSRDIPQALSTTHYDEVDDGAWRFPKTPIRAAVQARQDGLHDLTALESNAAIINKKRG
jgi:hypothetical protein